MEDVTLRCGCGLPVARVRGGRLVIESRHHGQTHISSFSLEALVARLGKVGSDCPSRVPLVEVALVSA